MYIHALTNAKYNVMQKTIYFSTSLHKKAPRFREAFVISAYQSKQLFT